MHLLDLLELDIAIDKVRINVCRWKTRDLQDKSGVGGNGTGEAWSTVAVVTAWIVSNAI